MRPPTPDLTTPDRPIGGPRSPRRALVGPVSDHDPIDRWAVVRMTGPGASPPTPTGRDHTADDALASRAATDVGRWTLTAFAFPPAGLLAITAVSRVDDPVAALLGGLIAGLGIGAGQWLALRRWTGHPGRLLMWWAGGTGAGLAAGLTVGAHVVGYGTTPADLAVVGLCSGAAVGLAQGVALLRAQVLPARLALQWGAAQPALWTLGWLVTEAFGIEVERQFAVFGATGALASSLLAGVVLRWLRTR
ncbi:hypothetical protein [Euzebya tangerina]|uniref:hypothetical protein n=1 Tax=Euzebya tangerina TaxID=591198 RepID=UPI0013C379C7|nr:hypothetical protein [Euzebya tangerina]